jgi:hypothetical protein
VAMWIVKTVKVTSIGFPLMLIALIAVRKLLDYVFTQSELYWLDHLLPDDQRRAQEDINKKLEQHFVQTNKLQLRTAPVSLVANETDEESKF